MLCVGEGQHAGQSAAVRHVAMLEVRASLSLNFLGPYIHLNPTHLDQRYLEYGVPSPLVAIHDMTLPMDRRVVH